MGALKLKPELSSDNINKVDFEDQIIDSSGRLLKQTDIEQNFDLISHMIVGSELFDSMAPIDRIDMMHFLSAIKNAAYKITGCH